MITGGSFRNEKFIMAAESERDADAVKAGLCGRNHHFTLSPYGNKVNLNIHENTLTFIKQSGRPFSYEEAHTIVKKIQLCEKLTEKVASNILQDARTHLESGLTLFYPSTLTPVIQVVYSLNWVAFETQLEQFAAHLDKVRKVLKEDDQGEQLKAFSNESNIISIYNYSMGGLYINRKTLEMVADILIEESLMMQKDKKEFVVQTAAFGMKCVIYMSARQMCQNADETFSLEDDANYNPLVGQKDFVLPMYAMFDTLIQKRNFSALGSAELEILRTVMDDPKSLEQYALSDTISSCVTYFIKDYADLIKG